MKKINKITTILLVIMSLFALSITVHADAYSAVKNKVESVAGRYKENSYEIKDIDGDGQEEGVIQFYGPGHGSARTLQIYKYKSGKVVKVLNDYVYGLSKLTVYKKGIIGYGAGHGGEWYRYYKLSGGKYKLVAIKSRVAKAGGSIYNGPWAYSNGKSTITKSAFNAAIKGIKKNKKSVVKF